MVFAIDPLAHPEQKGCFTITIFYTSGIIIPQVYLFVKFPDVICLDRPALLPYTIC